ncbi:MAG: hypothetical protein IJW00_09130 [Clostridia bacterium]|nr:hypothetical protein [Clostridia bacterium]
MTLSKCFTTVFDNHMKSVGFFRKGILYYRMVGNMLQGVRLETTNPYFVRFCSFPYWLYHKRAISQASNITRGTWVQGCGSLLTMNYYAPNAEEQNVRDMMTIFDLFRDIVLPYLDCVSTEEEYLQMIYNNPVVLLSSKSIEKPSIRVQENPTPEFFLYNQYYGVDPIPAKEAVEVWHRKKVANYLDFAEEQGKAEYYIQKECESYARWRDSLMKQVAELEQNNFAVIFENMCVDMKQQLTEHLKIKF